MVDSRTGTLEVGLACRERGQGIPYRHRQDVKVGAETATITIGVNTRKLLPMVTMGLGQYRNPTWSTGGDVAVVVAVVEDVDEADGVLTRFHYPSKPN